jgi:hypothetical protein
LRAKAVVTVALLSAIVAPAPTCASDYVYARTAASFAQSHIDSSICLAKADALRKAEIAPMNMANGLAGAAAVALLSGIVDGVAVGREKAAYVDRCMRRLGYAKLELSSEDSAELSRTADPKTRSAWIDGYLARVDSARIALALMPKVDPLPSAPPHDAFALHGIRLYPGSLHASERPVRRGQALVTGDAAFRENATVAETFDLGRKASIHAEKGAEFHLVDMRDDTRGEESSDWCGPLTATTVFGKRKTWPGCIHSDFNGYVWALWLEEMRPILTTSINAPMLGVQREGRLMLESIVAGTDHQHVELRLAGVSATTVELTLVTLGSGKALPLWRQAFPLADGGETEIPFWTKTVDLARHGDMVTSTLSERGDGTAPNAVEFSKNH